MPDINSNQSCQQIRAISDRVQEHKEADDWDGALGGLHDLLEHACAHHQVTAYEVWDELHELNKRAGDYDAAIAAK